MEKEPIKIKLSTILISIMILVLIISMIAMYYYYKNSNNHDSIDNSYNSTPKNETEISKIQEKEIEKLDIESEQIKKLYNYIKKFNYYGEKVVYQENKVTEGTIGNQLKLLTVFDNLNKEDALESNISKQELLTKTGSEDSEYLLFKKETIEAKAREIFGEDVTIVHENCSPHDGYTRFYKDGIYECYSYQGGGGVPWEPSMAVLQKAEQKGDEIYIYDKYVHLVEVENMVNGVYKSGTYDIYRTSDRKVKIVEKVDFDSVGIYNGLENLSGEEYTKRLFENIEKLVNNQIKTFKHTFKKEIFGNYYWVSTEMSQ